MYKKIFVTAFLLCWKIYFPQTICKLYFHHSNSVIPLSSIDISFEPIKNNKKGKVRVIVKKSRDDKYIYRISREKFSEIFNACLKIKSDTIAVKYTLIDASSSDILLIDSFGIKKKYNTDGLNKRSQNNEQQNNFWYSTTLIMKAAKLKMEDLIDY